MQKLDDLLNMVKFDDVLSKKAAAKEEKSCNTLLWVFAVIGGVAAVAAIAYAVYRYFTPDYLEDFEDDFDDDFEDDFFEDDDDDLEDTEKASGKKSDAE